MDASGDPAVAGTPYPDFEAASRDVLRLLQDRLRLGLWLVTRAAGDDQVVLAAQNAPGSGYAVTPGSVLRWEGSLCRQMVAGNAPGVAPRVQDHAAYADAENRREHPIEAYVAVPLRQNDGQLFGTLCGFDAAPQPDTLRDEEQFVRLQGRLLATILSLELDREQQQRRAERAESEATLDALTGLVNRRGWDSILEAEEVRCRRYGHPATVLVVDLNGLKALNDSSGHAAGDRLLQATADLLRGVARHTDVVARLGGDEFAVLAVESGREGGLAAAERVRAALADGDLDAAVGVGVRSPTGSLDAAWLEADRTMYEDKQRARRGALPPR